MRKLLFLFVAAILTATNSFAQSTLVATLAHGTDITMYYGSYALQSAYKAAVSGDIINLSGGTFQSVNIEKALTIRGAGIDAAMPTYIINSFNIDIPSEDANRLSMEGIICSGSITLSNTFCNPLFFKSKFSQISYRSFDADITRKTQFVNCKISGPISLTQKDYLQAINSFLRNIMGTDATVSLDNCVLTDPNSYAIYILTNCIVTSGGYASYTLNKASVATNCVYMNFKYDIFRDMQQKVGCSGSTYANVFKNYTGTYSDAQTFELTDEAKSTLIGTDGTQIGIYGGIMPYDSTPLYPQITKMNVANKTTVDGKLSVEIEVSAAD